MQQLKSLQKLVHKNADEFMLASIQDSRKPQQETVMMELIPVQNEIQNALNNIYSWTKSDTKALLRANISDSCKVKKDPLGYVFILVKLTGSKAKDNFNVASC